MTELVDDITEGACSSCGEPGLLRVGGLLNRPICPTCTLFHGLAPRVLADLRKRRLGVVTIEGTKIRLGAKRAVLLIAQRMAATHRREEAQKAALAAATAEA